jgi:hypothetical protein
MPMGRRRRVAGELTNIDFYILVTPSEYLDIRDAAERADESMAEYARRALNARFLDEYRLPLGKRYQT